MKRIEKKHVFSSEYVLRIFSCHARDQITVKCWILERVHDAGVNVFEIKTANRITEN